MKLFFSTISITLPFLFLHAGFAPDSLVGYKIDETDTYYIFQTDSTLDEHDVEEKELRPDREYSYQKTGDNSGVFTKPYPGGESDVFNLTFTSSTGGVITNDSNKAFSLTDLSGGFAPLSIAGYEIEYVGNGETETATFASDGTVSDGEDWTYYEYEKISNDVGVVTYTFENEPNPAPEVETLTFTTSSGGTYDWIEYSDSTKSTPIDQGSGQFTILTGNETTSINVNPLAFGAFRDRVYLQGENGPVEIDGASEINFDLQLVGKPGVTTATLSLDNVSYDLTNLEAPAGFRTNYGYSTFDNEIFDVESSSDSDWSSYINGKTFDFDLTIEGSSYSYSHNLPSVSSLPAAPNISLANILKWEKDSEGYDSAKVKEQDLYEFSWGSFSSAGDNDYIVVHLQELDGDDEVEVISETVLASDTTSFSVNGSHIEIGKTYVFYVEWVKVTEQSNPSGFSHVAGTDTSLPLLQTSAASVTALDFALVASTVAISDPNGQPVVVQLGDEYQWNSTLDGVTLWALGVGEDGVSKKGTAKFDNGNKLIVFDMVDEVNGNETYNHPYIVDENGYIRVTESVYQYYNVVGVEDGAIHIIQDSNGLGSVADDGVNQVSMLYFTTRVAAEEYYYSKANPKDWMWFDHYPWVYSQQEQGWLYFYPSGGKLLYWSNRGQAWREFNQ
ncbi:hypothetical protein OAN13_06325 [Opitutales bacterium]|nr:hypothetical protein [Opitutales bacterium]